MKKAMHVLGDGRVLLTSGKQTLEVEGALNYLDDDLFPKRAELKDGIPVFMIRIDSQYYFFASREDCPADFPKKCVDGEPLSRESQKKCAKCDTKPFSRNCPAGKNPIEGFLFLSTEEISTFVY